MECVGEFVERRVSERTELADYLPDIEDIEI